MRQCARGLRGAGGRGRDRLANSPLDLDLRGMNGARYAFRCPRGEPLARHVIGSGPYTDDSSICSAAVHAGALHDGGGGDVTIEIRPGELIAGSDATPSTRARTTTRGAAASSCCERTRRPHHDIQEVFDALLLHCDSASLLIVRGAVAQSVDAYAPAPTVRRLHWRSMPTARSSSRAISMKSAPTRATVSRGSIPMAPSTRPSAMPARTAKSRRSPCSPTASC